MRQHAARWFTRWLTCSWTYFFTFLLCIVPLSTPPFVLRETMAARPIVVTFRVSISAESICLCRGRQRVSAGADTLDIRSFSRTPC